MNASQLMNALEALDVGREVRVLLPPAEFLMQGDGTFTVEGAIEADDEPVVYLTA